MGRSISREGGDRVKLVGRTFKKGGLFWRIETGLTSVRGRKRDVLGIGMG